MKDIRMLRIMDGVIEAIKSGYEGFDAIFDAVRDSGCIAAYNDYTEADEAMAESIVKAMVVAREIPRG